MKEKCTSFHQVCHTPSRLWDSSLDTFVAVGAWDYQKQLHSSWISVIWPWSSDFKAWYSASYVKPLPQEARVVVIGGQKHLQTTCSYKSNPHQLNHDPVNFKFILLLWSPKHTLTWAIILHTIHQQLSLQFKYLSDIGRSHLSFKSS